MAPWPSDSALTSQILRHRAGPLAIRHDFDFSPGAPVLLERLSIRLPNSLPKRLAAAGMDLAQSLFYRERLLPPFSMRRFVGDGTWELDGHSFLRLGRDFIAFVESTCGLDSTSRILDIGCGCGRVALPLTSILQPPGCYVGIEPVKPLVDWCTDRIASRFPNFRFVHSDLANRLYNPLGGRQTSTFRFPVPDAAIDLVIANSVFTHLVPEEAANYLAESARVLAPGGKLFATFFLVESGSRSSAGDLDFKVRLAGGAATIDARVPERAVAYPLGWIVDRLEEGLLSPSGPPIFGTWAGRGEGPAWQDTVIAVKRT